MEIRTFGLLLLGLGGMAAPVAGCAAIIGDGADDEEVLVAGDDAGPNATPGTAGSSDPTEALDAAPGVESPEPITAAGGGPVTLSGIPTPVADAGAPENDCMPGERICNGAALQLCTADQSLRTVQVCASAALCQVPACEGPDCDENRQPVCLEPVCDEEIAQCNGNELQFCGPSQDAWQTMQICESAAHCSTTERRCRDEVCEAGELQCSGSELQRCEPTARTWETLQVCETPGLCNVVAGACELPECDRSATLCDGARFLRCNDDLTEYEDADICSTSDLCDPADGCKEPVCLPGEYRCTGGGDLQICDASQTGYSTLTTCMSPVLCNPVDQQCDSQPCEIGETRCNGPAVERCALDNDSGWAIWEQTDLCVNSALCHADGCRQPVCDPDSYDCEGATLRRCRDDLTDYEVVEECESAALCRPAEQRCVPPSCEPDDCRCVGDSLRFCRDDLTGFVKTDECNSVAECDSVACACSDPCVLGQVRCNGNVLQTCQDRLIGWETVATCVTSALCDDDDQECNIPECNEGEFSCDGDTLERCRDGRDGFDEVQECDLICDAEHGECDICEPGEYACDADALMQCTTDGQRWELIQECNEGLCLPAGQCLQCDPAGSIRCDEGALLQCSGNRRRENQIDSCGSPTLCDDDNDRCLDCEPAGGLRCDGALLLECDSDQLGETVLGTCLSAAECEQTIANGERECEAPCEPGTAVCSGQQLQECNPATGLFETSQTCDASEECDAEEQACLCSEGDFRCSGGDLERCISQAFEEVAACSGATLRTCIGNELTTIACDDDTTCDNGAEACLCENGEFRCVGGELQECVMGVFTESDEVCTPDGRIRECDGDSILAMNCPAMTSCDADAEACTCAAGTFRCQAGELEECISGSFTSSNDSCTPTGDLRQCTDDSLAIGPCSMGTTCNEATDSCTCEEGELRCAGGQLQECQGGAFLETTSCAGDTVRSCVAGGVVTTTCETGTSCNEASSECVCDLPLFRCEGATLQECAMGTFADSTNVCASSSVVRTCQTGELESLTCPDGTECNGAAGGCIPTPCTNGVLRCNGTELEQCVAGVYVAGQPVCDGDIKRECEDGEPTPDLDDCSDDGLVCSEADGDCVSPPAGP